MTRLVGIDLGTTNCVVAYMDGPEPKVVLNRDNELLTPSVVSVHRRRRGKPDETSEILVGDGARANFESAPRDTISSIKRLMGRSVDDPEVERLRERASYDIVEPHDGTRDSVRVVMGGAEHSPADISALILRRLVDDAAFRIGEPVTHAVITVPAYFSQAQRAATREAGLKAGITVIQLIDEPTAAALAFGLEAAADGDGAVRRVVVYDLGGGTFDVAVGMMSGGTFVPLDIEGDMWLGGDDFDALLGDWAVQRLRDEYGVHLASTLDNMVAMRAAARRAKERLSSSESADFRLASFALRDDAGRPVRDDVEVTRAELDAIIAPRVRSTIELTEAAVRNAQLTVDDIDHVVMVGNSTALRPIQQRIERLFGAEKVIYGLHPKHCVAIGAAFAAVKVGPHVVCPAPDPTPDDAAKTCGHVNATESAACERCGGALLGAAAARPPAEEAPMAIAPYNYGIASAGDVFNLFIEKGATCPTPPEDRRTIEFRTSSAGQRLVSMPVYGGEDLEHASANDKQAELMAVLPPGLAEGAPVRVTLWLDESQIFVVDASLDDSRELEPFSLAKGEPLARVVGEREELELRFAKIATTLPRERRQEIEHAREDVLRALVDPDARQADTHLRRLADLLGGEEQASSVDQTPRSRLASTIAYARYVARECAPALQSGEQAVEQSVRDADAAADRSEAEVDVALAHLNATLDALPRIVVRLVRTKLAITSVVVPESRSGAEDLTLALDGVMALSRTDPDGAWEQLDALERELDALVVKLRPKGARCPNGHEVPPGVRLCPRCGEDPYILVRF